MRLRLWMTLLFLAGAGSSVCAELSVSGLRTEMLEEPLGIESPEPGLSWRVASSRRGERQTAYRILAASDRRLLVEGRADLWDSGKIDSDETLHIPYKGKPLGSSQRVFWQVRVWDRDGKPSDWSSTASWGMGVLRPGDWRARWIAARDTSPLHTNREALHLPPAQHLRKEFRARRNLARAVLHVSALGVVEMHLNGRRVGDAFFEPGWADYSKRVHYRTHDVTALLRRGDNCLGAILADGWYAGYVGYGLLVGYGPARTGRNFYGKTPALLAQLELEYADGSTEQVVTDTSWQVTSDGPIREADLIMGEVHDARRESRDWSMPDGGKGWRWEKVVGAEENGAVPAVFHDTLGARPVDLGFRPPPRLQAYAAPPIRITESLPVRSMREHKPGVFIADFGQNFAGIVRLSVKGNAGNRVRLRFGEMLHPDGRLMTENLRRARATDEYILRGDPVGETWSPRFTYHGFRYVEITGYPGRPDTNALTGLVLHNDTPPVGEFACSDEVMTQFWRNTTWTQRANFIEIPTDCPQRDERLGWMGDAQIYVRTATYNADVAAFFTKWLDDVVEAQRDFGAYPDYCPYPMAHGAPGQTWGAAWTDAGIICPWTLWRVYGDRRLLERMWPSMQRFMDWRLKRAPDLRGRKDGNTWGDWLNVNDPTPIEFVDAAYFALDARLMSEMAEGMGNATEAAIFRELHEKIRKVWREEYLLPGGRLKVESQSAYAIAIAFRLVPDDAVAAFAAELGRKVRTNDVRMTTGFLGTKSILPALTAGGEHDLAVQLFQSRRYPSWGYEVINGATTVWERWDSYTKEFGFNGADGNQNAAMNSFSHYAFGAVMEWAFRNLAGIDTLDAGYKRIAIAPRPPGPREGNPPPIDWVRARYDSVRGRIESAWRREPGRWILEVVIPANTTAWVRLPAPKPAAVREGGKPLEGVEALRILESAEGRVAVEIGSGSYRFEIPDADVDR